MAPSGPRPGLAGMESPAGPRAAGRRVWPISPFHRSLHRLPATIARRGPPASPQARRFAPPPSPWLPACSPGPPVAADRCPPAAVDARGGSGLPGTQQRVGASPPLPAGRSASRPCCSTVTAELPTAQAAPRGAVNCSRRTAAAHPTGTGAVGALQMLGPAAMRGALHSCL